jgi:hypothetical protein
MLEAEAARLCRILLEAADVSPLLHLGSSTRHFREVEQPHIEGLLFGPLRRAGVAVTHCDLKQGEGIDVSGDVLDPATLSALKDRGFRTILVANLLEHVRDRAAVAAACEEIVGRGGLILATVPSSYPYHADPIDSYYRPSPARLAALFARSEPLLAELLSGPSYAAQIETRGSSVWKELGRTLFWLPALPLRPRGAASRIHRWLWYKKAYRISIVLLRTG